MAIKNTDVFINAALISNKKQELMDWLMANVFTPDKKWVAQDAVFTAIQSSPLADLSSPALVSDAVETLKSTGLIISWDQGFPV